MTVTYTVGDVREVMATIADGSVDLIATSPPFLALRSYLPAGHDQKHAEIGSEANPAAYIDMLLNLTAEWGRVLAPHGSIAIELGDTYSGSGGAGGDYNEGGLRDGQGVWESQAKRTRPVKASPDKQSHRNMGEGTVDITGGPGWPRAKSLALIPQLYAVALAYGINPLTGNPSPAGRWLVRNVIVWHRPNPAVGALGDKVRPSTSYIVIATRSPKRWFDLTAVRHDLADSPGNRYVRKVSAGDIDGRLNATTGIDRETNKITKDYQPSASAGAPPLDTWTDEYDGTHDTWTLTTQPSSLAHYAMWPAKLAERLVLSMCPAQVCRTCGEPRRRVEGKTPEYQAYRDSKNQLAKVESGARANAARGRDDGLADDTFSGWSNSDDSAARGVTNITVGWTDCKCKEPKWTSPTTATELTIALNTLHTTPSSAAVVAVQRTSTQAATVKKYRHGIVLDPFAGSGTTLAVADLHGRDAIGIDLDPRNHDLYPARYHEVKRALYGTPAPQPGQGVLAL